MNLHEVTQMRDVPTSEPLSWRQERRADRAAEHEVRRADLIALREVDRIDRAVQAEQERAERDAAVQRKIAQRTTAAKDKVRRRKERSARWTARRRAAVGAVTAHVPLPAVPVVVVSLVMGWSGQTAAAVSLGMGAMAPGVPVLTEGMTLTLAVLTAAAIAAGRPHRFLLAATWAAGLVSAAVTATGHLIEDTSPAGMYRAGAYAAASLAGLVLWALVMRSKKAAVSGKSAASLARWRRLRHRHPVVARRAKRIADLTGVSFADAWPVAWERTTGAGTGEPTIREIHSMRRTAFRRGVAQAWDGRRRFDRRGKNAVPDPVPGTGSAEPEMQFPSGQDAFSEDAALARLDVSRRQLKKAARLWMQRYELAAEDARYRSPTGHLGVSSYGVAEELGMRRSTGPALVEELIERQLIPLTNEREEDE